MKELKLPSPRSVAWGEITAAVILSAGALAERFRGHRAWVPAVPIVLVNFVAFFGQLSFFGAHRVIVAAGRAVIVPLAVAVIMALALESIAVYWAWLAHKARKANDSAFRLALAAYATALLIGTLNYSHFCGPGWQPTAFAVAFALSSVISPALWAAYSNRESRDELKAAEQIEDHAVRLGSTRTFFHPIASTRVRSRAAWLGENRPAEAIKLVDPPKWVRKDDVPAGRTISTGPRRVKAKARYLAGLSEAEQAVVLRLAGVARLPSIKVLADSDFGGNRYRARKVLDKVRAGRNGGSHGTDDDG